MLSRVLEQLLEKKRLLSNDLSSLSDLGPTEVVAFSEVWRQMDEPDRLALIKDLRAKEKGDLRADFRQVYYVALRDPSSLVRQAAVRASAEDSSEELLDHLLALIASDPEPGVRTAAAEALGRFAYMAEVGELPVRRAAQLEEALLAMFFRLDESLSGRMAALASVGYLHTPRVGDAIAQAYEDYTLRPAAIKAMGRNCDPAWLPQIVHATHSQDPELRREAAAALGEMEDRRGVDYLVDLVDDPDLQVRLAAIKALGQIGGEKAREALLYCAEDHSEAIRKAVESALSELEFYEDPLEL